MDGNLTKSTPLLLTSTKANSKKSSRKEFSKTAKSAPSTSFIGTSNDIMAEPPSPKLTTPLVPASPRALCSLPILALPILVSVHC